MHHIKAPALRRLTLAATALLAACTVGPEYVKPAATPVMPAAYRELEGWKLAQPRDGSLKEAWWELYADPQLNTLEHQVAGANQNVQAAEAQYRQARALVGAARAGYLPSATVGASATSSRRSANLGGSQQTSTGSSSSFQLPLDLAWEADIWGKVRRGVEASQAGAQASGADLAALLLGIQSELALDYLQLRLLDAQKQLLDETASAFARSLELTKNRYASGVASKADVLQAETQLKSTQAQAMDLGVQRSQLEHAIAALLGKPASGFSLPPSPLATLPPTIPAGLPSELLERRPDIAAAERRMAAANAQIGVAEAAFYPTVRLSASAGFEASSLGKWLTWPSRFWAVGPAVAETIFDGGLRRAQSDAARASYDATVAGYRQTVLTAFQEVEDSLAALRILEQEARVQDEAVQAARQSLEVTTNQYRAGIVSYLNVLVAQTVELSNRRTAIDILGRRMSASVQLVKALGGGWQPGSLDHGAAPGAAKEH